ncbi:MAG: deoxyribodipyrimidine photo-lyase [Candidatus Caldarchaeum sp.]
MFSPPTFMRPERIHVRKAVSETWGEFVLYVMDACQRSLGNFALEYAVYQANRLGHPLIAVVPVDEKMPHANLRRFKFMFEGLTKLREVLETRKIRVLVEKADRITRFLAESCFTVLDTAYLGFQRAFRNQITESSQCSVVEVEGNVVVPVELASNKPEPYARTIRPKLIKHLNQFLEDLPVQTPEHSSIQLDFENDVEKLFSSVKIDRTASPVDYFTGGEDDALSRLKVFTEKKLRRYAEGRSDPGEDFSSELSPYLRYGMVSPVQVVKAALEAVGPDDVNLNSLVNELVVWRELARNAAYYSPLFGTFDGLPEWAKQTLEKHKDDRREYVYDLQTLEKAETHDIYWNAAQRELLYTGKIHNYMRMYWCKKLIEWTDDPRKAFEYAVYLNDRYGLDGVDPNSYLGISWCFGAFDRPFFESKIYGKIRKMTEESLKRKPGISRYLKKYEA